MKPTIYEQLVSMGFTGKTNEEAIQWLNFKNILRIEPYWRFLGGSPGFSWTKSWEEYSPKIEVDCETWEELLEIALNRSVEEALQ